MAQEVQVIVKNIFKNADMDTSKRDFTQKWIELINQMEKNKNILPPPRPDNLQGYPIHV